MVYTGQTQNRHYFENMLQLGLCNVTVERVPQIQFCGFEVAPEVCERLFKTFGEWVLLKIPANLCSNILRQFIRRMSFEAVLFAILV